MSVMNTLPPTRELRLAGAVAAVELMLVSHAGTARTEAQARPVQPELGLADMLVVTPLSHPTHEKVPADKHRRVVAVPGQLVHAVRCGRNAMCPCGSGRRFKKCCLGKSADQEV